MSPQIPPDGNRNATQKDVGLHLSRNAQIPVNHDGKEEKYRDLDENMDPGGVQSSFPQAELDSEDQTYSETYADIPGCGSLTPVLLQSQINDSDDRNYDDEDETYAEIPCGGSLTPVQLHSRINGSDDKNYDNEDQTYSETYAEIPGGGSLTPVQLHSYINGSDGRNYDDEEDVYMEI